MYIHIDNARKLQKSTLDDNNTAHYKSLESSEDSPIVIVYVYVYNKNKK